MLEINESDFRPIRDFVFIEADAERGRKKKLEDGKEIFIDTDFIKLWLTENYCICYGMNPYTVRWSPQEYKCSKTGTW